MEQRLDFYKANPDAIDALSDIEKHIGRSTLGKSLIDLVRLRASQINGCASCVDTHAAAARRGGETTRRLATLAVWRETPFFVDRERAALEWTEALALISHNKVPDAVWNAVRPHFSDEELVDLTLLISTVDAWNRFSISFREKPSAQNASRGTVRNKPTRRKLEDGSHRRQFSV